LLSAVLADATGPVTLQAHPDNDAALSLYEELGFEVVDRRAPTRTPTATRWCCAGNEGGGALSSGVRRPRRVGTDKGLFEPHASGET